jgi:phosphohistidine phosphatase
MDLFILRHAIAEERSSQSGDHSQRRLTRQGAHKLHGIAKGMKSLDLKFDLILSSPYLRAKETAEIVADVFHKPKILKLTRTLTPEGNPRELLDELKHDHSKCQRVLLIGHEPYLGSLISLLLSGHTDISVNMKKGGLCALTIGKLHYGRCATLEWLLTPRQLRCLT